MSLDVLPNDCFAHISSYTSPSDAGRLSMTSSAIRSAADSDNVWENLLPSDYQQIFSRLVHPPVYSSKKELFLRLCNPLLIDKGKKIFSLEKSTGKKRYVLSARELEITWADSPLYWSWKRLQESRFAEVVELRTICWLEINGNINSRMLSQKTVYAAYLIVKFADRAYGLDTSLSEVSLQVGNSKIQRAVCLSRYESKQFSRSGVTQRGGGGGEGEAPRLRKDGWMEVELGSFYNHGGDSEVKMGLKEVTGEHLKGGLIVEGIELRPET